MPNYTQSNVDSATLLTIIHHALEELLKTKLLARDLYRQFVVLGLNSIRGVELAARLSSKLDRHISPLLLWQHPTPVALAASLAGNSVTFAAEAGFSSTNLPTGDQDSTEPLASRLTPREREIVQLIAEGHSNKEVADRLGISVRTAETHRLNVMRKLNVHTASDLTRYAIRNQMIQP